MDIAYVGREQVQIGSATIAVLVVIQRDTAVIKHRTCGRIVQSDCPTSGQITVRAILPVTLRFAEGVVVPIPTNPLLLM